jgi:hypothetical protein
MQSTPLGTVPETVTGDPNDVAVALEVAGALWEKGNKEEALRWLRRAVEAANDAGEATRAAALAEAAGGIEASLVNPSDAPPPPTAPSAPVPSPSGRPAEGASARPPPAAIGTPAPAPPRPTAATAPVDAVPSKSVPTPRDQRIRVSVKTSVRDPELLLLRPLREGQRAPTGTREGFLILPEVEAGDHSHANGGGAP